MCYKWFCRVHAKNLSISDSLIQKKAGEIAENWSEMNFTASIGWLEKFCTRHNIIYEVICGENNSVNVDAVDDWNSKLIDICEGFVPKSIFNLD